MGTKALINGDLTTENLGKAVTGVGLTALGIAIMTKNWKAVAITVAFTMAFDTGLSLGEKIKTWIDETYDKAEIQLKMKNIVFNIVTFLLLGLLIGLAIIAGGPVAIVAAVVAVCVVIWQAFVNFFQIHSPSKKMAGLGGFITQGLIDGIGSLGNKIKEKITAICTSIKNFFTNGLNGIKNIWNNIWDGLKMPNLKMPHISWSSKPASRWIYSTLSALGLPTSIPIPKIDWYAKGGSFSGMSVIGVGEYTGASTNPEIVAPQKVIYDTVKKANDNNHGTSEVINFVNEIKLNSKTLAREIINDLNVEARRQGFKPIFQK